MDTRYIAIHPHKGYLNTSFNIFSNFEEYIEYDVFRNNSGTEELVESGGVSPNLPHSVHFNIPGDYTFVFNNGISKTLHIEDGYKFGGGSHKKSYVFDECPWVFVIMYDRTYFYNRETGASYVETISPDTVLEVSTDYVIFQNDNQGEQTIYSLEDQCPILCISDLICFNSNYVVWKLVNSISDEYKLKFYSLSDKALLNDIVCENYILGDNNTIYILQNGIISRVSLGQDVSTEGLVHLEGTFLAFPNKDIAISSKISNTGTELYIFDLPNSRMAGTISLSETLASLNHNSYVNLYSRRQAISQFNLKESEFPEATIQADYCELNFFYTPWKIFYTKKVTTIYKSLKDFTSTERSCLMALNSSMEISLQNNIGVGEASYGRFCFYNSRESYVTSESHPGAGYTLGGEIFKHNDDYILQKENVTYFLNRNGYWDAQRNVEYKLDYFNKYGILHSVSSNTYKTIHGWKFKGDRIVQWKIPVEYIRIGSSYIFPGGKVLNTDINPCALSPNFKFGVDVTKENITLYKRNSDIFVPQLILEDLFDTSTYRDVILSEDGRFILYKDKNSTHMMNIGSGDDEVFDNLSYVKHTNGIRTTFITDTALQPRIVDPISKQIIDHRIMSQYKFISPRGDLYADTRLGEYTEYLNKVTGDVLTSQEYQSLREKYSFPVFSDRNSSEYTGVVELRRAFVLEYFSHFEKNYPKLIHNDITGRRWENILLDEDNSWGTDFFLSRVFQSRGVAIIRKVLDDSIVARIALGEPLVFLNYVSFSYDSRYVSIVGYRSNGTFVLYDIESQETVIHKTTQRAVWSTAFSVTGAVTAYTSNPNTFFVNNFSNDSDISDETICGCNFLAFSPDGQYFAVSHQGYVSKYDRDGNIRLGWGHQASSIVNIRKTSDVNDTIVEYNDLSDQGVADSFIRETVASVSFSNSNTKLMMVGKDGVVVIRNLKLNH